MAWTSRRNDRSRRAPSLDHSVREADDARVLSFSSRTSHRHADRPRAAQSGTRRPPGKCPGHRWRRRPRRSAPGRGSSSRPSCRCAAIRPRTSCCDRRSSTRARASSPRSPARVRRAPVIVGFPERSGGRCHNALAVLREGRVAEVYRKQQLPNYTVFDEERYFEPGHAPCVIDVDGTRCGLLICEDVWFPGPSLQAQAAGARVMVVVNGSPYHTRQQAARVDAGERAGARNGAPLRLRQPRRRPGRARVRRRVVRHGGGRRRRPADAGVARGAVARDALPTAFRSPSAARSTRGSNTTSTRRW